MAKKPATVDDQREPQVEVSPDAGYVAFDTPELRALVQSAIVTVSGGVVSWREGQLEHLARQYAADPVRTEADYHDDLAVAKTYSAGEFTQLVEAARG